MVDQVRERIAELVETDAQFRATRPLPEVTEAVQKGDLSASALVRMVLTAYADRPALGVRERELVTDPATGRTEERLLPGFRMTSYAELHEQALALAADLYHHPEAPLRPGDFAAFLGFTSPDFTTLDLAGLLLGAVAVPLQASPSAARLIPIIAETGPRLLASSVHQLPIAVECALAGDSVRRLVVFDHQGQPGPIEAARARLAEAGSAVLLETLEEVLARGRTRPAAPVHEAEPEDLALLIYTSGSTGAPKGARYSDRLVAGLYQGFYPRDPELSLIGVHYLPMSHVAGRSMLGTCLAQGGIGYFTARADLSTLFEDFALARPTETFLVPRLVDVLFRQYAAELDQRLSTEDDREAVAAQVRAELRERTLGGRLVHVLTGSAPITEEKTAFLDAVLGVSSVDGYGCTEVGMVMVGHRIWRDRVLDWKLVDVPELGYLSTDRPHPRGELLVRTSTQVDGYHRRPELNAEVFDAEGFYRTGDIMAQTGPEELRYLDRSKNVLKLAQGEFVAIARLDAVYLASPLIRQSFLYGNSTRSHLLAVLVPSPAALEKAAGDPAALRALLLGALREVAAEAGLAAYEVPREIIVETEPFSTANGLLSDINKLLRPRLAERYGQRLEQLYAELAEREQGGVADLRARAADRPVLETVLAAAGAVLGTAEPVSARARFVELGGDSLSAVAYANLLKDIFAVDLPVSVVINPAADLAGVARHLEQTATGPGFASVHGENSGRISAAELTLDRFLPPEVLAAAPALPSATGEPRTVLLSGANGFLGRFLCLEWLRRLAARDGRLVCVIRGADVEAARARLRESFTSDPALLGEFDELSAHLEVLPGDIAQPGLGLDADTWSRLAAEVELVVHPAALVNHLLPYQELFGPNVFGTAELIRLALTTRRKPVAYVSSVGVLHTGVTSSAEDADIREISPYRDLAAGYAGGYASSKWAGEVLLREAHELCGLPVAVFRSDLIMAHRRYTGQVNVPDMFTRLLHSVITTGLAPKSFYRRPGAHYDGLPVDFTAAAITALTERASNGFHTYNVLNPHQDGVSLDVIVDWLAAAGHPITRIADYQDWHRRIGAALEALPEKQRRNSLLPLLHTYAEPADPEAGQGLSTTRFAEAVRAAGLPGGIPHITAELIGKYAADLKALHLV